MFEALSKMEYPGRVIVVGQSLKGLTVALYAITGRSSSSQARKLVTSKDKKSIVVELTDEEILKRGDPDLLIYPAIILKDYHLIVSNGKQTESIAQSIHRYLDPEDILRMGLKNYTYEPDKPNFTPRISACIWDIDGTISIIRRKSNGEEERISYNFDLEEEPERGYMISTYTGENIDPLPSFVGSPIDIKLPFETLRETVDAFYEALGPEEGKPDFRVAAAGVYYKFGESEFQDIYIKNRHDS